MEIRIDGERFKIHIDRNGDAVKNDGLWRMLSRLNDQGADIDLALGQLGFHFPPMKEAILSQSAFVIPGHTRYGCVRCGECCRNAMGGCPTGKFEEPNACLDYDNRPSGCRRFPFRLFNAKPLRNLLLITSFCQGHGKGGIVTRARCREMVDMLLTLDASEREGEPQFVIKTHFDRHQNRWMFGL